MARQGKRRRRRRRRRNRPGTGRSTGRAVALFALALALALGAVAARDVRPLALSLTGLMVVALVAFFVATPMPDHPVLGPVGRWLGRLAGLRLATIVITVVLAGVAIAAGQGLRNASYPAANSLRPYLDATFADAGTRAVPRGGTALVRHAPDPPTVTAARIHEAHPADDQRYTPAGVVLRYERDIVAVLPRDRARQSTILVEDAKTGHRHFARLIGEYWGPGYGGRPTAPPSALAVPDGPDTAALALALGRAADAQGRLGERRPCYGWDVEILSGRRAGRWTGSSLPGRDPAPDDCAMSVQLTGWVDPDARRFAADEGPGPGRHFLNYEGRPRALPAGILERLDIPFDEIMDGPRAGKGLVERAGVMPLLAAEAGAVPPVPFDERPVPRLEPLAEVVESDVERRARDGGFIGVAATSLRDLGYLILLIAALAVISGLAIRGVRAALRRPRAG